MNNVNVPGVNEPTLVGKIISWLFGMGVLAAGVVNTFWGQPAGFGIFFVLLSLVYFLPVKTIVKRSTGFFNSPNPAFKNTLGDFYHLGSAGSRRVV